MWRVWAGPTTSSSFCPSRKGTTRPIFARGMQKRAASAAMRRSQCRASSQPPAKASPCTMAMVGWREASIRRSTTVTRLSGSAVAACCCFISCRSIPEQKDLPSPRTTTARTAGSSSRRSNRVRRPERTVVLRALRRSGRFSRIVATPPSTAVRSSSDTRPLCEAGHESVAASLVRPHALPRVAVHQRAQVHRVGEAADLVLDLEDLLAAVGIDNDLEAVLDVVALLAEEPALLQLLVGTGEVGDVDRDVVAIEGGNRGGRLAEDQLLAASDAHVRGLALGLGGHAGRRAH